MIRVLGTVAVCGIVMLGMSSPAVATRPKAPKAQLKVGIAVKGGSPTTVRLQCGPAGGTHPDARAACQLLEKVDGHPERLNVSPDAACTRELQPQAVAISGRWDGKKVRWGKVFDNACLVKAATGEVFTL
ncbi:SSI family serine proteinase inhibitor [Nonomuraea sp. NPDC049784]|uniref:SSI family serine proteinase inhibitor n=1 Tax=Nonomuraea sp. NPDC049784 TaxID=3154361 RepID=UPI0033DC00CB